MASAKLTVVKGEFGHRDLGKLVQIQPMRDPPIQKPALYTPPTRVMRNPESIWIDPDWQRNITERGKKLIDEMVAEWDWSAFMEPSIYFDKASGREIAYDGQHTLIAAASRQDIITLPCNLHGDLETAKQAASSFGVRNFRRIPPTVFQRFKTALVAEEAWALRLMEIARRVGFTIAVVPGAHLPDQVQSISTMREILDRRGTQTLEKIMQILTGVAIAPIREIHIKAIDMLMHDQAYAKLINFNWLRPVIRGLNNNLVVKEAVSDGMMRGMVHYQVLANIYLREYQGVHGAAKTK